MADEVLWSGRFFRRKYLRLSVFWQSGCLLCVFLVGAGSGGSAGFGVRYCSSRAYVLCVIGVFLG